jgi:hypothetical protein
MCARLKKSRKNYGQEDKYMKNMVNFSVRMEQHEIEGLLHLANVQSVRQRKNIRAAELIRFAIYTAYPEIKDFNKAVEERSEGKEIQEVA